MGPTKRFTLTIDCENAAFGETVDDARQEVARLLELAHRQMSGGGAGVKLYDLNGNHVGACGFNFDDAED